jgi:hypothetical protein
VPVFQPGRALRAEAGDVGEAEGLGDGDQQVVVRAGLELGVGGRAPELVVQSADIFRRRPMRNFVPAAPPASTVGALRVLCRAGLPMSLLA